MMTVTIENVRDKDKSFDIFVEPHTTVLEIKSFIELLYEIPWKSQSLIYESAVLKDDKSLDYYGISDGKYLYLVKEELTGGMQISVQSIDGRGLTYMISPGYTLKDLKLIIQSKVKIPCDQQRLIYGGLQLNDDFRTLQNYNIVSGCTIHIVLKLLGS